VIDFKGSSETSHKLHASFTRQQAQKPNLHSSGLLSIGRIAGGELPQAQTKARLLIYTIDGSDEEKQLWIDSWRIRMIYHFDQFELDVARFELRQEGAVQPLEPQVFALLAYLIEHRKRLVPRDELFEKLWDGRVVTDSVLTSRVKSARKAIGDNGKAQRLIKTIHGKGFRFIAHVRFADDSTQELIAELARLRWLLLIAGGSSFSVPDSSG